MKPFYLSAITHLHGEPRPIAELGEPTPVDFTSPEHGLDRYRVSDREIWQIAADAAAGTRARADGDADKILYATENDRSATDSLARISRRLETPRVPYLAISGHACGNLGPALELAGQALASGRHRRILFVMADTAAGHSRVMSTGLSVFSDGGAACMLTAEVPDVEGPVFAIGRVTTRVAADTDPTDPTQVMLSTVALGEAAIEDLLAGTGLGRDDFRHALFANYRLSSQRFLASAIGLSDRIAIGPIAEYAHSFSADILANLDGFAASGALQRGDRSLVSATGPYTWSLADVTLL